MKSVGTILLFSVKYKRNYKFSNNIDIENFQSLRKIIIIEYKNISGNNKPLIIVLIIDEIVSLLNYKIICEIVSVFEVIDRITVFKSSLDIK